MASRIARMLSPRLVKMASPMRKWPILSSTICGKPAMRRAVAKSRPWPAWHSMPTEAVCSGSLEARELAVGPFDLAIFDGVTPCAGVQLDNRGADRAGRIDGFERWFYEQGYADAGAAEFQTNGTR